MTEPAKASPSFVPLPLLAEPESYRPCTFDYSPVDTSAELVVECASDRTRRVACSVPREAWLAVFRRANREFEQRAAADDTVPDAPRRAAAYAAEFLARLDEFSAPPTPGSPPAVINCWVLCELREELLRQHGFADCFARVKAEENAAAMQLLPSLLAELDAVSDDRDRLRALVEGAFAGNIFDLGTAVTAELFAEGKADFRATRAKLQPRPWTVDDLDALWPWWAARPHMRAVLCVDNSGADIVLGMLPLAREIVRRGGRAVIAANETPSINDITIAELRPLLARAAEGDAVLRDALADGRLSAISSGNDMPLIDLRRVSPALAAAAEEADLLVLEGMGRSIETNLGVRLRLAACLNLGMVKLPEVAACLRGPLYGCVCRFLPPVDA